MRLLCLADLQMRSGRMQCCQSDVAEKGGLKVGLHLSLSVALKIAVSVSDHRLQSGPPVMIA